MLTNWSSQHGKLKGYLSQNFSVEKDEITGMCHLALTVNTTFHITGWWKFISSIYYFKFFEIIIKEMTLYW